jgi:DNA-binding NarL/FixJ family response regulator
VAVRVLLVDDAVEVLELVARALELRGGFDVVGRVTAAPEAIEGAAFLLPDVIVLDLGLDAMSDDDVIAALRVASPESAIVVFSGRLKDLAALGPGVQRAVAKGEPVHALLDVISHAVADVPAIATEHLPPEPASVPQARRLVRDVCARLGYGPHTVSDAELIVTELVANAVVHAATWCTVSVKETPGSLRIEVMDRSPHSPVVRTSTMDDEDGRGLRIVALYAAAWGIEAPYGSFKIVWAELAQHVATSAIDPS